MNTTLVIMAAGMGSRFGGLKQLEPIGPNGEAIIDYSVYDAIKAGFDHIIFIVRKEIVPDFETFLENRYPNAITIELALQENPASINPERTKPRGTAHAVLAVKDLINTPFAILNADDFYGREAFVKAHQFLNQKENNAHQQGLIAYRLSGTLSPHGSVSRGICEVDKEMGLKTIREILKIKSLKTGRIIYADETGAEHELNPDAPVSMNFWCLKPGIFRPLSDGFSSFISQHQSGYQAEYMLPEVIDQLIRQNQISVKVSLTRGPCFGITYKEDKSRVRDSIRKLIQSGIYPSPLWK